MLRYMLTVLLTSCAFVHAADYGVGFGLSLDYGVASVYFANDTAIDVAKIEGGSAYRHTMRVFGTPTETQDSPIGAYDGLLGQQSLRDYLPPWLFPGADPHTQALARMMRALKTATEAFMETEISYADVVLPFQLSKSRRDSLNSACSSLSLQLMAGTYPPAGLRAAQAHGIGMKPDDCSDFNTFYGQLILAVDYSRSALTLLLLYAECGYFEIGRILHNSTLGSESSNRQGIAEALRDINTLPLNDGNGEGIPEISELVLLGESAGDHRLHDVLREVLGGHPLRRPIMMMDERESHKLPIDPVFAAPRGAAWYSLGCL